MIRFFVLLGGLAVLALIAALVAPPYVDWNQYKSRFESQASRALGMKVDVQGTTSVRLLPLPSVTFTDMRVGQTSDEQPILTADTFKMNIELAPLLKGDIVIADMQFEKPRLDLRIDAGGKIAWPDLARTDAMEINRDEIALENITLRNGIVRIRDDRFEREFILTNINAQASARKLSGPWRANGTLSYLGDRTRLQLSTGRWQESRQIRLKLRVQPQARPYDLEFEGPFELVEGAPQISGLLKLKPMRPQSDEDRIDFRRPEAETALPVKLESDLILSVEGANVPAFKMDIGTDDDPYSLTGTAKVFLQEQVSFRINAEGQQVDLQRLPQGGAANNDVTTGKPETNAGTLADRLARLRGLVEQIPRFRTDGSVSLFLPAVVAGDTVIRELGLDIKPLENQAGWQIANLEAQLPGRTDLRANGDLLISKTMSFRGDLIVASRQPSGLASWLGQDISPELREMTGTGFSGKADLSADKLAIDDLELVVDGKVLKGSVLREISPDDEQSLVLKLRGEEANFDQLNALVDLLATPNQKGSTAASNLDLELNADRVVYSGIAARLVDMKLARTRSSLVVDRLDIGDIAGAAVSAKGQFDGSARDPIGTFEGTLLAAKPAEALTLISNRFGPLPFLDRLINDPSLLEDAALSFNAAFGAQAGGTAVNLSGRTGGSDIDLRLTGLPLSVFGFQTGNNRSAQTGDQTIKLIVVNESPATLLLQLGVPIVSIDQSGRSAFRFDAEGSMETGFKTDTALTLKDAYISAAGTLKPVVAGNAISANGTLNVVAEANDLDPIIALSGRPFPGFGTGRSARLRTAMVLTEDNIRFDDFRLALDESETTGQLTLKTSTKPRASVDGTLAIANLQSASVLGLVNTGAGAAAKPVFEGLDAQLSLVVDELFLARQSSLTNLKSNLSMRDGNLAFDSISGDWMNGNLSGNVTIAEAGETTTLNGQLALEGADMAQMMTVAGFGRRISGSASTTLTFEAAGASPDDMIRQLTGGGTVTLKNGRISGLNQDALGLILAASDASNDGVVAEAATDFAEKTLYKDGFDFQETDFAYSIVSGSLRADTITAQNDQARIDAGVRSDLMTGETSVETNIAFQPGREAVAGANPEISFSLSGKPGSMTRSQNSDVLATYLGMRISERKEREFEAQRADILERQRLLRTARLYTLKEDALRIAREERERIRQLELEEQERQRREEARRRREEAERARIAAELKAAEERATRAAAREAGERAKRQQQIEELRRRSEDALQRLRQNRDGDILNFDSLDLSDG